jgi:hypothetical protein
MNTGNMTQTTITPNPDSIQEVRTLQNNIMPKYTLLGASVVLLQTRSGSSEFHGALWEYFRNDDLDARNFFSPSVLPLKQNIFGGTLGGPVYIPKLFPKDKSKTFFFFSEQHVNKHIASTSFGATPTQDMRNGLFTDKIIDPTTGNPFPLNSSGQYVIPASRLNANSLALLNAWAQLPNDVANGFNNYLNANPEILTQNDVQLKIDHNISEKLHLMGEWFDLRQHDNLPNEPWASSPFTTTKQSFVTDSKLFEVQGTYVFSPTMVNQLSIGINDYVVNLGVSGLVYQDQLTSFQTNLPFNGFLSNRLPDVAFSGGWASLGITETQPLIHASDLESTLTDDWSWIKGKHTIEAGLNIVFSTKRQNIFTQSNGTWQFSGRFTGDPIADYLLGDAASFYQQNSERRPYIHGMMLSPYVQDTFKVNQHLTLNYGVRIEFMPLPQDQPGFASNFEVNKFVAANAAHVNPDGTIVTGPTYDPLDGLVINSQGGTPQNFSSKHQWYLNPTVGFAWDPFGDGKTSLRGGFGVTRTRVFTGTDCTYACPNNPPFLSSINLINPQFPNPIGTGQATTPTVQGLSALSLDNQASAIYTYSLSLERQVGGWLFGVGGAGNLVRHQGINLDWNQPFPAGGYNYNPSINTGTSEYFYAPYYGYGGIGTAVTTGNSNWTGMLLSARHQVGHGLFVSGSYTYAHGLSQGAGSSFGTNSVQDSYNVRGNYGNSSVDVRQMASFSWIYDIPFMQRATGLKGALLGGWKYNGIASFQSGLSQSAGLSVANQGLATRPDVAGALSYPKTVAEWFNPSAFTGVPYGFFGNAGVGTITGPGLVNFDMGMYKDFKFAEKRKLQFRAEFFNIFNHTNFSGISTTYGSGNFGAVTSALDPRIVEFSARIQY